MTLTTSTLTCFCVIGSKFTNIVQKHCIMNIESSYIHTYIDKVCIQFINSMSCLKAKLSN